MTETSTEVPEDLKAHRDYTNHHRVIGFTGGPVIETGRGYRFIADQMTFRWTDDKVPATYTVTGQRLKKDGRPGELTGKIEYRHPANEASEYDRREALPDWAQTLLEETDND
jgi:hypothetical protein